MPNLPTFEASVARGGCEVHLASQAYQVESSDDAVDMQGVESAALGAETAEECTGTADTVVDGSDTAADHSLPSDLLDGTALPAVM
jgi:hypothetical protein